MAMMTLHGAHTIDNATSIRNRVVRGYMCRLLQASHTQIYLFYLLICVQVCMCVNRYPINLLENNKTHFKYVVVDWFISYHIMVSVSLFFVHFLK